jgi:hypothetical protein
VTTRLDENRRGHGCYLSNSIQTSTQFLVAARMASKSCSHDWSEDRQQLAKTWYWWCDLIAGNCLAGAT